LTSLFWFVGLADTVQLRDAQLELGAFPQGDRLGDLDQFGGRRVVFLMLCFQLWNSSSATSKPAARSCFRSLDLALVIGDQQRLARVGREHLEEGCLACDLAQATEGCEAHPSRR